MSDEEDEYEEGEGEEDDYEEDNRIVAPPPHESHQSAHYQRPKYEAEDPDNMRMKSVDEIMQKADKSKLDEMDRINEDYEGLGENFEDTPWVPPTLEKAQEFRMKNVYRMGNTPLRLVKVVNTPDLSEGVSLYFQFTKSMAVFMFVSTVLSIPLILFSYFGERVPQQDRDALGLYRFTLGNMGYDPNSPTYFEDSSCTSIANSTCLHLGSYMEVPLTTAANVITVMEFLQILAFFATVWYLTSKTDILKRQNEVLNCSAADYTIIVRGLPPDTSAEQLIAFFSHLYPLDKPDWRNRPAIEGARPVEEVWNSGNSACRGSWVAEAIVHKRIGSFLTAFKNQQHLMEKLYRSRAQMKMYSDNTPHSNGPNLRRYQIAEREMIKAAASIDMIAERQLRKGKIKLQDASEGSAGSSHIKDPQHNLVADAVAGFVTFEYTESMARCIEDYAKYSKFPWSLCYPDTLKFRGNRIRVSKAPEPDEMVWENLEVGKWTKYFRRIRTALLTLIILIFCFVVILQSTIYKNEFNAKIPNLSLCYSDIPELFSRNATTVKFTSYELTRPPLGSDDRKRLDLSCDKIRKGSFYSVYTVDGNWENPVTTYNITACSATDSCPAYGDATYCPCISTIAPEHCDSKTCIATPKSPQCHHFPASTMGACYCMTQLLGMLSSSSVTEVMNNIKSQSQDQTCNQFFINYTSASGFSYLAIFVTVIVNKYLLIFLKKLTNMESHSSLDKEEGSLILKIFISLFFNMAVLVLIASGRVDNQPAMIKPAHVLQGSYKDFDPSWYGNVGSYFITTFIIQSISPLISNFISYYITGPLNRTCIYPFVSNQSSHKITRQDELNKLEVGPVFDVTTNQAQLLALLFFGMTYAAGLPIMMPLACITFAIYFHFDKVLLCRYFQRPPYVGEEIMRLVLRILPYAAILRLAIACWMYGNTEILQGAVKGDSTAAATSQASAGATDPSASYSNILAGVTIMVKAYSPEIAFILKRIGQPNVFPLFILLVIIVLVLIIRSLWTKLPFYWIGKFLSCLVDSCRRSKQVYSNDSLANGATIHPFEIQQMEHPLRQEIAPFTGPYLKYLRDNREIPTTFCTMCSFDSQTQLSAAEMEEGWEVVEEGDYVIKVMPWKMTGVVGGVTRTRGERKRTYELITDHGCSSYSLDRIPAYKLAIEALKQGVQSLMDYDTESGKAKHSLVERYNQKKATAPPPGHVDAWKADDADHVLHAQARNKPKLTSKEKNQKMSVDMYKSSAVDEDSDSAEEEEDNNDRRGNNKDMVEDVDSDGSGLV